MIPVQRKRARIGILDHTGPILGGAQLVVSHMAAILAQDYDVELIHDGKPHDLASLSAAFLVDLTKVKERAIPHLKTSFGVPGFYGLFQPSDRITRSLSEPYDLFIYSGHGIPPPCFAKRGLVYCHFPFEASPLEALKEVARWTQQIRIARVIKTAGYRRMWRIRMHGYQRILANSQFTARWIQRRWDRAAEVAYPPVDLNPPVTEKRPVIVSVGRFTGVRTSKNQLDQVTAFREFLNTVREQWSLRLIGSCGEASKDRDYLEMVRTAACGLPVQLLVNVDRTIIIQALAEAKLFWHTMGLSNDETKWPEYAEHFGIATVEAMRAGCVPSVIDSGGQREIIEDGVSGWQAKDLPELVQKSSAVARDAKLLMLMGERARQRSMIFTGTIFGERLKRIVSQCLN